jgi:hypothetical protein
MFFNEKLYRRLFSEGLTIFLYLFIIIHDLINFAL